MGKSLIIKGADFSANKIVEGRGVQLEIVPDMVWILRLDSIATSYSGADGPGVNYNSIDKTPCSEGDIFTVTAKGDNSDSSCWAFLDSSDRVIACSGKNWNTYVEETLIAPKMAAFFCGSCRKVNDYVVFHK